MDNHNCPNCMDCWPECECSCHGCSRGYILIDGKKYTTNTPMLDSIREIINIPLGEPLR